MIKGLVNRIIPFSSVDGPGNRTAIFLQGCNFNCSYCHNPETISVCKSRSSPKVLNMSVEEVMGEIYKSKSFISGITVSGGECTLQSEFLTHLFRKVKKINLTCFVDTNGSVPLWEHKELVDVMGMAMIDIKSFNNEEHMRLTGMGNATVIENVKYLALLNKIHEIRTVIVPEVLDNNNNVDKISRLIAILNPFIRYKLIKYRGIGVRTDIINSYTPKDETMKKLAMIAEYNGCKNVVIV